MRYSIKHKLTVAFTLVIILAAFVIVMSLYISSILIKNDNDMKMILNLKAISMTVTEHIRSNFSNIRNYELILKQAEPFLKTYNAHLKVTDLTGFILFDSDNPSSSIHMQKYLSDPKSKEVYFDANLIADTNGLLTIVNPLVIDDNRAGTVYLTVNGSLVNQGTGTKAATYIICLFLVPLLIIAIIIFIISHLLSRDIIVPLNELNTATESIAESNFDFEIKYNKNNELGQYCQAFDQMRVKLKDSLDRQAAYEISRKELIASISHDLRTPISTIKGYAEGLSDGITKDSDKVNRYLSIIKTKADNLDRLIDDLFQFSQLEMDKFQMQFSRQNSRIMLDDVLAPLLLEQMDSGIELMIIKPIPDVTVLADAQRIGQVVNNMIQNARQYSASGGKILFQAIVMNGCLRVSITDSGQGIPVEDMPRLFDPFYRGEKSRSRLYGGAGLGLAICKHIIQEHGGRIWVESTPGEGSTFYFTLPVIE